jgi:hypothetical protein
MKRYLLLSLLVATTPVVAQTTVPSAPKDAGVATLLGFVFPGGGQYYAEDTGKGLLITMLTAGAIGLGVVNSHGDVYRSDLVTVPRTPSNPLGLEFQKTLDRPANHTPLVIGAAVAGVTWFFGAITAGEDATRANQRRSAVSAIVSPTRYGLALAF